MFIISSDSFISCFNFDEEKMVYEKGEHLPGIGAKFNAMVFCQSSRYLITIDSSGGIKRWAENGNGEFCEIE